MLHFFRKIRHDLIANSQSIKYLKYAIGEIVLVVLGILIALQINNWNEERKNSELFDARLVEIEKELIFNIEVAKDIIDYHHDFDSMAAIILFDGLKKEDLERDSSHLYRGFPTYVTLEVQDQAFKKLLEIENGLTSKQDSLYQNLVSLYDKDVIYSNKEIEKKQVNSYYKIRDSYKNYEWYLDRLKGRPYTQEEIDYYLNNSMYKIDFADYATFTLNTYNDRLQQWEKRLLKNYNRIYDYLEERNLQHSDSLFFEYDPAQYKHYIGVFKPFETSTGRANPKMLSEEILKIELIENKYILSEYFQGKKVVSTEIMPITKYYFRSKKIEVSGYFNIIFDQNNKVSGMSFSTGNFRVKFKKTE